MTMHRALTILALLFYSTAAAAQIHAPWPGGIGIVPIDGDDRPTVLLGDRPVMVVSSDDHWNAIVGIPLEHDVAVPLEITIQRAGAATETIAIDLREASYRVQRLTVDRKYVDPGQEALDRIFAERKIIDAALTNWRDQEIAAVTLQAPVAGTRGSSFGSRRIFNDQPRSPHKGMDIAAATGTPIESPLPGIVTATGDFYFNGNTVIVDHGQGYVSLYCHLSEIDVTEGQEVSTGELLGKVGATGRVTGAHLHFATYLNGTAVDPALLLASSE
ncbi:MAG: peptidoglycan DD-metalloendopeptidase family protein [Gammaproteobacteria bacterium]|nr:peptidoglycan DD-metalloendopeptidase family protein [Gammaproteobacteria bacterium]